MHVYTKKDEIRKRCCLVQLSLGMCTFGDKKLHVHKWPWKCQEYWFGGYRWIWESRCICTVESADNEHRLCICVSEHMCMCICTVDSMLCEGMNIADMTLEGKLALCGSSKYTE